MLKYIIHIKEISKYLLIFLISLCLHSGLRAGEANEIIITPYDIKYTQEIGSVRKINIHNIHSFRLVDINNSGNKDIIAYTTGNANYLSIRTTENLSIAEIPLKGHLKGNFCCQDITNDSIPEVFYIMVEKFDIYLNIYNAAKNTKQKINIYNGNDFFKDGKFDVALQDVKFLKHSSGDSLLLIVLNTGHDRQPRGVIAYKLPDFEQAWEYLIGSPPIGPINIYDINDDGKSEIFFSTVAVANGVSKNNFTDQNSYFGVLDEDGNNLFKYEYSGPLSYCFFDILTTEKNILLYGYSNDEKTAQPDLIMIDAEGFHEEFRYPTKIRRQHISGQINSIQRTSDYKQVFFDVHNRGYFLNNRLKLESTLHLPLPVTKTYRFNRADGTIYYLFVLEDITQKASIFLLMDKNLKIIGKQIYPIKSPEIFIYNETENNGLIYFMDYSTRLIYEWYLPAAQLKHVFNLNYFVKRHQLFLFIIALIILLLSVFTTIANIISGKNLNILKYKSLSDYLMENPYEAIVLIDKEGTISSVNNVFKNLFSQLNPKNYINKPVMRFIEILGSTILKKNIQNALQDKDTRYFKIPELDFTIENKNYKFRTEIQKVYLNKKQSMYVLKFFDLTAFMRADRISSWAAIAQKLAHDIKNPLMSMTLSLGRLEKQSLKKEKPADLIDNKYFNFIREDIERMRDSANQFMRFTSSLNFTYSVCQLNDIIIELVQRYQQLNSDRIKFQMDLEKALPDIKIDVEQTKHILKYIIDNGIDAIQGNGTIQIKTETIEKFTTGRDIEEKCVQLTITDSGTGIAKENRAKIFEPGFTTKDTGSGFGLAIAKHVLEEQGGSISISGKKDVGTIVSIELPISQKEK
ncbi:MAG: hypothetical protein K8R79_09430 [Calditrichales bacterium]|nr:hypothetical protein [Calditrichales bacterium]